MTKSRFSLRTTLQVLFIDVAALALEVGAHLAADFGAFVPVDAEPLQAVEQLLQSGVRVALLIGVFDAEHQLAAGLARIEPIEESCASCTDVSGSSRAGGESYAYL